MVCFLERLPGSLRAAAGQETASMSRFPKPGGTSFYIEGRGLFF